MHNGSFPEDLGDGGGQGLGPVDDDQQAGIKAQASGHHVGEQGGDDRLVLGVAQPQPGRHLGAVGGNDQGGLVVEVTYCAVGPPTHPQEQRSWDNKGMQTMIEGIEPYYQTIADSIAEQVPGPWSMAWVDAVFFSEHICFTGVYVPRDATGAETKPKSFATDVPAEEAIEEIRELFRLAGEPVWGRAHFELRSDGGFNMTWSYEDCDENGCARFDEEAEKKRMKELRESLGITG